MGKLFSLGIVALPLLAFAAPIHANPHPKPPPGVERTAAWNADTTDLPTDPSIIYGRLPNGLRYAIRPNHRPQNQVLVRMAFDFGSAAEAEDEQGLAHFIEHMAFNGSTNVPEGEMVKILERLGLAFGADSNASTGYTMTDYQLDLPRSDPALIERALFLMRETASELSFNPAAVDRERGVVIAELRQSESYQSQRDRAMLGMLYPGTFYATRFPIGTREVLENATAEKMQALYRKWYVPDRARIVVVGPVDPVAIEREIARKFGDWRGSGKALGDIDRCSVDTKRAGEAGLFVHPQINEGLLIERIMPDRRRPDNFETNLLAMKMNIVAAIISDRLARKSRAEDIPYLGGGTVFQAGFCDGFARVQINIRGKDGSWRQLMPIAEQMVRQAVEHGFTKAEVAEQLQRFDASFANGLKSEATNPSGYYANALTRLNDDVINSAEQQMLIWRQARPFLTADAIHHEFSRWYGAFDDPMLFLSTRAGEGMDKADLAKAYGNSRAVAVAAPSTRAAQTWSYADFGTPGKVVADTRIADLGIRTIRFENGVLLNLKKTDFEADRIRFSVRIDGGSLHFGKVGSHLAAFMNSSYTSGGLGKYDYDDLRALLAGSTAQPGIYVGDDHFGSSGSVVARDLERQMQLTAAYLTDPGKREEAVRLYRRGLPEWFSRRDATPQAALGSKTGSIMTDNDPRFSIPSQALVESADFRAIDAALGDALTGNRLEIGLVGALDENEAVAIVARTFGALPKRKSDATDYADARTITWSSARGTHEISHRGEPNQLSWQRIWTTADDSDQRLKLSLELFASMAQIRLLDELRERLGKTYGAFARSSMSDTYAGRGTFTISTDGDPKDLAAIESAVDSVMAEMLAAPASPDLFERARKPALESYVDWRKSNGTWWWLTSIAQTQPYRLQRYRDDEKIYRSLSADEVWQTAKRMLEGKPSFTFRALPAKP
ncbi:MAG: hypothetical protein RL481_314 [Pseudomonadota bacterium]